MTGTAIMENLHPGCYQTRHVSDDKHLARITFIANEIGWGEQYCRFFNEKRGNWECISTTGVMTIKSIDMTTIITAYALKTPKAYAIFKSHHVNMPNWLYMTIKNNEAKIIAYEGEY